MKAKYIISVCVFSTSFALNSCVDLDTYPEDKIITSDQKEEVTESDPSKAEAGVNAVFTPD